MLGPFTPTDLRAGARLGRLLDAGRLDEAAALFEDGEQPKNPVLLGNQLLRAAEGGRRDAVEMLVAHGVDPAYRHPFTGWTAATAADANGHFELAGRAVELGAPEGSRRTHGYSDLHRAVLDGDVVPALVGLDTGAVDVVDAAGCTPLVLAVQVRNTRAVAALLSAGADPNHVGDGFSALAHAAYQDSRPGNPTHLVEVLLSAGADPNPGGYPPLFNSVNQGWSSAEVFSRLLAAGAYVHARGDWEDETVLHRIAVMADATMVDAALDVGANIEARDCFGRTPLFLAALTPNAETFVRLADRGAEIDVRDADGSTVSDVLDDSVEADDIRTYLDRGRPSH